MATHAVGQRTIPAVMPAEIVPADRLRGATVVDPSGKQLGVVTLVVRHADGTRVVVVGRTPTRSTLVLDLKGGYLDEHNVLHASSRHSVQLLPARTSH